MCTFQKVIPMPQSSQPSNVRKGLQCPSHPMGCGMPLVSFEAEQSTLMVCTGNDPAEFTAENIANFKRQINALGFSYDWDREVRTDPNYYKWTQWIFARLRSRFGLEAEVPVNWVEELGNGDANEEVTT